MKTTNEQVKPTWSHPDRKQEYFEIKLEDKGFCLCQRGGSLSSIICFKNKEEAILMGWKNENN